MFNFKRSILSAVVAMTAVSAVQADDALNAAIQASLQGKGAIVQNRGMVGWQNCLGSVEEVCNNFANVDVMYAGLLFPCSPTGCITANDQIHPMLPMGSKVSLDKNEAVVIFGVMPKDEANWTYFGIQQLAYERNINNVDDSERKPLKPGENAPAPTKDDRYVIDAAMGDSLNQMNLGRNLDPNADETIFTIVMTGNQVVFDEISTEMISAGFPADAINLVNITDNFVLDGSEEADTARLVGRFTYDIGQDPAMEEWMASNPFDLWRVTLDKEATEFVGYQDWVPAKKDEVVGVREIEEGKNEQNLIKTKKEVEKRFGKNPSLVIEGTMREYDDENCIEAGSYCWGNNDDTLYANAMTPNAETGELEMYAFDFSKPGSKVVIAALDHKKTGWSAFWNFGIFQTDGWALGSFSHNNHTGFQNNKSFLIEISEDCGEREACYEISFNQGAEKLVNLMNRNYLNPLTGTGQSPSEFEAPTFYYYEGKK